MHLVLDNHATHKHPAIRAWLAERPRFKLRLVPNSCSWLNLVERFFANLTSQRLRRGSFDPVKELQDAVMENVNRCRVMRESLPQQDARKTRLLRRRISPCHTCYVVPLIFAFLSQQPSTLYILPELHKLQAASVQSVQMSADRLAKLFDGNPATLSRTENQNPLQLHIAFRKAVSLNSLRIVSSHGKCEFELTGLSESGQTTLVPRTTAQDSKGPSVSTTVRLGQPYSERSFLLTIRKTGSDNYVHLNEVEFLTSEAPVEVDLVGDHPRMFPGWSGRLIGLYRYRSGFAAPIEAGHQVKFTSSDPGIVEVDHEGHYLAKSAGVAKISIEANGLSKQSGFYITAPPRKPVDFVPTNDLAIPSQGFLWEVPFIIVCIYPTDDGMSPNRDLTQFHGSLQDLSERTFGKNRCLKWMIEEASRYHGYKDNVARPSLGFRCMRYIEWFEDYPIKQLGEEPYLDMNMILRRIGLDYLSKNKIKEVWVWQDHNKHVVPVESNMSSPITGDVSNSYRHDDLPILKHTYTVYNFNFNRGASLHNFGHQLESVMKEMSRRAHKSTKLFLEDFVGEQNGKFVPGRAGNCHFPPNGTQDYDYHNPTAVMSDCEDWRPDGTGQRSLISSRRWDSINYRFPTGDRPTAPNTLLEREAHYYIYWLQNLPGRNAAIPYGDKVLTNWWRFFGDYDAAVMQGHGLYEAPTSLSRS